MDKEMDIVLVVLDTLRQDHVGAYGNKWIKTPHLDKFAEESVHYTRVYAETLPTLPFRRSLYTGQRNAPWTGDGRPIQATLFMAGLGTNGVGPRSDGGAPGWGGLSRLPGQ